MDTRDVRKKYRSRYFSTILMYADLKHQSFLIANQLFRSYRFYIMISDQCSFLMSKAPIVPTWWSIMYFQFKPPKIILFWCTCAILGLDGQLGIISWSGKNSVLYEMSVSLWVELLCHPIRYFVQCFVLIHRLTITKRTASATHICV